MPTSAPWPTADMGCDLVKISASGADADLEILRPGALGDEMLLEPGRRRPSRAAPRAGPRRPRPRSAARMAAARAGIALDLLLDHALEHAAGEGDARGLERLQVDRRQQPGQRGVAPVPAAVGEDRRQLADASGVGRAGQRHRDRRRCTARSSSAPAASGRTRRRSRTATTAGPGRIARQPDPADQRAGAAVRRQGRRDAQILVHAICSSAPAGDVEQGRR